MAQAGIGSRRDCEELIQAGRVTLNGRLAQLGEKADPQKDRVLVDGQPLKAAQAGIYIAVYKPRGVLSAVTAPDPRPTVRELVPVEGHLYPVGRLDVDSEGLILLTNDGDLANRLTHPRYGHEKEYRVLVARRPDDEQLETWRRGVVLEDGYKTQPADIRVEGGLGKGAWLRIILREGRKRQIRETGMQIGLPVVKIIRVRIGTLTVGVLRPREWRYLTPDEVAQLKGQSSGPAPRRASPAGARAGKGSRPSREPKEAGGSREPGRPREPGGSNSSTARRSPGGSRTAGGAKPAGGSGERPYSGGPDKRSAPTRTGSRPAGGPNRRSSPRPADPDDSWAGERSQRSTRYRPQDRPRPVRSGSPSDGASEGGERAGRDSRANEHPDRPASRPGERPPGSRGGGSRSGGSHGSGSHGGGSHGGGSRSGGSHGGGSHGGGSHGGGSHGGGSHGGGS
ncbi:MAG: pseudouridine synthase, partial [Chloroflexota bacterium]